MILHDFLKINPKAGKSNQWCSKLGQRRKVWEEILELETLVLLVMFYILILYWFYGCVHLMKINWVKKKFCAHFVTMSCFTKIFKKHNSKRISKKHNTKPPHDEVSHQKLGEFNKFSTERNQAGVQVTWRSHVQLFQLTAVPKLPADNQNQLPPYEWVILNVQPRRVFRWLQFQLKSAATPLESPNETRLTKNVSQSPNLRSHEQY